MVPPIGSRPSTSASRASAPVAPECSSKLEPWAPSERSSENDRRPRVLGAKLTGDSPIDPRTPSRGGLPEHRSHNRSRQGGTLPARRVDTDPPLCVCVRIAAFRPRVFALSVCVCGFVCLRAGFAAFWAVLRAVSARFAVDALSRRARQKRNTTGLYLCLAAPKARASMNWILRMAGFDQN